MTEMSECEKYTRSLKSNVLDPVTNTYPRSCELSPVTELPPGYLEFAMANPALAGYHDILFFDDKDTQRAKSTFDCSPLS